MLRMRSWFRDQAAARDLVYRRRPQRQPVGVVGCPGAPTRSSPAATSTACPTAARTTGRSASCRRSSPWTCCASEAWCPPGPIAVVNFADEEGARFGVACVGVDC